MMKKSAKNILYWFLHLLSATLLITIFCSLADFCDTPTSCWGDYLAIFIHWGAINVALFGFLIILSLLPYYLFLPIYTLIAALSAALAYFRYTIGFVCSSSIFDILHDKNILHDTANLLSWQLVVLMSLIIAAAVLISLFRKRYNPFANRWLAPIGVSISIIILTICFAPFSPIERSVKARIPFNIFSSTYDYIAEYRECATEREQLTSNAIVVDNQPLVVAIIGEAARPDNMSINGYWRQTTPNAEALNMISYKNVYSAYTYTTRSVPHIMTRADENNPDLSYTERSFIDVFKTAHLKTAAIINQKAEKQYIYFMHEADTLIELANNKNSYRFSKWLDEDVLPPYYALIEKNYNLIVIQLVGSHWWYCSHYPDKMDVFKPTIKSRIIAHCDSMEIVNSYDNTIYYTDYILSKIVEPLQDKNALVCYLSDHGEMLGERGKWLHAVGDSVSMHTAAMIWASDQYKLLNGEKYEQALSKKDDFLNSDFFFHTIIDGANIECDILNKELSLFKK